MKDIAHAFAWLAIAAGAVWLGIHAAEYAFLALLLVAGGI